MEIVESFRADPSFKAADVQLEKHMGILTHSRGFEGLNDSNLPQFLGKFNELNPESALPVDGSLHDLNEMKTSVSSRIKEATAGLDHPSLLSLCLWHLFSVKSVPKREFNNVPVLPLKHFGWFISQFEILIEHLELGNIDLTELHTIEQQITSKKITVARPTSLSLFLNFISQIQDCLSFNDIWNLFTAHGLPYQAPFADPRPERLDAEITNVEIDELFMLYDPEQTNRIGMNDYFLFLKDIFLNRPQYILFTTNKEESIFDQENSYKEVNKLLERLLFEVVRLNKKMYGKSKNVSFTKELFWQIFGVILENKLLSVARNSMDAPAQNLFEEEAKKMVLKIEKLQEKEREEAELRSKKSQTDLGVSERPPHSETEFDQRNSRSNPPSFRGEKTIESRAAGTHEISESTNQQRSKTITAEKSKIKITVSDVNQDTGKTSNQPKTKTSSVLEEDQILRQTEALWKKALGEIFAFYNKLQKATKGENSFEGFKEKMNCMSLGEWIKFCHDFSLTPPKLDKYDPRDAQPQSETARQLLTNLFKKESKGSLGINYISFEVACSHPDHPVPALPQDRNWTREHSV